MVAARVHLRLSAFRASLDKANTLGLADIDQLLGKAFTCVYCNQVSISVKLSRKAGDKERQKIPRVISLLFQNTVLPANLLPSLSPLSQTGDQQHRQDLSAVTQVLDSSWIDYSHWVLKSI